MHTAEIVIGKMQGNRGFQMGQFFTERIGQPRESSAHHAKRKVLPFDVARTDIARIGRASHRSAYCFSEPWWCITAPSLGARRVDFLQLREVHRIAECRGDSQPIRPPSVSCELRVQAPFGTRIEIAHKRNRVGRCALACKPREDQLRVGIHSDERVLLSNVVALFDGRAAFPLLDEAMQLIALNEANRKIFQFVTHHCGAAICRNKQQPHDGIAVNASHALGGADRTAFDKALDYQRRDFRSAGDRVPRQFVVRFAESGIAGLAAPTLNAAFTEVSELLAGLVLAFYAGHGLSPLDFLRKKPLNLIEVWMRASSASELAPPTVPAESGALNVSYGLGWWLNRDNYGLTVSKANLNPESHADSILPESPAGTGLSHLEPK
jgi:hypothetical protein